MEKITEKEWAKLMLEMDLKSQSGSIWTDEKSELQKEKKTTIYQRPDFGSITLDPDPVYYNGKVVDRFPPLIIE
jgi:hypothetical protein